MPPTIADLLHGLTLVTTDEFGMPSTTSIALCAGRDVVRDVSELPEGRYELHFLGTAASATAFRAGLLLGGSNTVEALPCDDPGSASVLVRFADGMKPDAGTLEEAIPLVRHADPGREVVTGRWRRMRSHLFKSSASPSSTVQSIALEEEKLDEIRLRIRYGPWAYHEKRRKHIDGPELRVWIAGDSDRHRIEVRFDGYETRDVIPEFDTVRDDLATLALRHGGRLTGRIVVFPQPDDMVDYLRDLEPFAEELTPVLAKAAAAAMKRRILADKVGARTMARLRKGAKLEVGATVALRDPDGGCVRISHALFDRMSLAGLVRRTGPSEWIAGTPDPEADYVEPEQTFVF